MITGAAGHGGAEEAELFVREEGAVVLVDIDTPAGEEPAQRLIRDGGGFDRFDVKALIGA